MRPCCDQPLPQTESNPLRLALAGRNVSEPLSRSTAAHFACARVARITAKDGESMPILPVPSPRTKRPLDVVERAFVKVRHQFVFVIVSVFS